MSVILNEIEVRVLGSLVEKQLTTPEYYPLTLNALAAACNQKSNREPVMSLDEASILAALDSLRERNLVYLFHGSTSRVVKYKHMLPSVYDLDPAETAVMCVLMLRGPQTTGEIRGRTDRLFEFQGLSQVQETLDALARRDEPLVIKLERQPGQKDARHAHLLSGSDNIDVAPMLRARAGGVNADDERITALEIEIGNLRNDVAGLRATFDEFKKQFE